MSVGPQNRTDAWRDIVTQIRDDHKPRQIRVTRPLLPMLGARCNPLKFRTLFRRDKAWSMRPWLFLFDRDYRIAGHPGIWEIGCWEVIDGRATGNAIMRNTTSGRYIVVGQEAIHTLQ